ncbi:MAG: hypothetical protein ACRBDL_07880 [Alphaproteobacteria bacterium]
MISLFNKRTNQNGFKGEKSFCDHLIKTGLYDTETDVNQNFDQLVDELKDWLHQKGFEREISVLDFMLEKKDGQFRKDGETPAALHEVTQAIYLVSCLEDGLHITDPAGVLAVIFSHDLGEDFNIRPQQMADRLFIDGHKHDDSMAHFLYEFDQISMHYGGEAKPEYKTPHDYSVALRKTQNAGLAKLFDNLQNAATIIGGLSDERASEYNVKIHMLLDRYISQSCENYPEQAEIYKTLQKAIGTVGNYNRHDKHGEALGKPLKIEEDHLTAKGLKLPLGLDPYMISATRIWERHPTLKEHDAIPDVYQTRIHNSDSDNPGFSEYTPAS